MSVNMMAASLRCSVLGFTVLCRGASLQAVGIREIIEVCILTRWSLPLPRSRQLPLAAMPVRLGPAYPRAPVRACSRGKVHFLVERLEAGIRTQRVEHWLHFEPAQPRRAPLVRLLEPVDGLAVLTQAQIDQHLTKRSNEAAASELI